LLLLRCDNGLKHPWVSLAAGAAAAAVVTSLLRGKARRADVVMSAPLIESAWRRRDEAAGPRGRR